MKRKKRICLGVLLALTFVFTACGAKKSLADHGMDVVKLIEEGIQEEGYVEAYTAFEEIAQIVNEVAKGDFSEPETVYAITVDTEELMYMYDMDALDDLSEELRRVLENKMYTSLGVQLSSRGGANCVAVTSILQMDKTFVYHEKIENQIYLYTFEDARPIMVVFTTGEDGAVLADGCVILWDEFKCGSAEEVEESLSAYDAKVDKVKY